MLNRIAGDGDKPPQTLSDLDIRLLLVLLLLHFLSIGIGVFLR